MADTSHISFPIKGMNKDAHEMNMSEQGYDFAMNAEVEGGDSGQFMLQNQASTLKAFDMPARMNVIGKLPIIEQNRVLLFLVGNGFSIIGEERQINNPKVPKANHSLDDDPCADCDDAQRIEIGKTVSLADSLTFRTIGVSQCMGFDIHFPISATYRSTRCGIEVVFTDGKNDRRRIEFEYTDEKDVTSPLKVANDFLKISSYATPAPDCGMDAPGISSEPVYANEIDCSRIAFQPAHPNINLEISDEVGGGSLKAGTYQFMAAWSDEKGNALVPYTSATNPAPMFSREITVDTDYLTGKALVVKINAPIGGPYDHFNLAVAETINSFTKFKLVGTFSAGTNRVVYTGNDTYIDLNANDIFNRIPYFKTAQEVTSANNILMFRAPGKWPQGNWQRVAEKIKVGWQTVELPMGSYRNSVLAAKYKGYTRDEVVALGVVFEFDNGDETVVVHIPGRAAKPSDIVSIPTNGSYKDAWNATSCELPQGSPDVPTWKVKNTATRTGAPQVPYSTANPCVAGDWAFGEFGYWESIEKYPNDQEIWGDLAGRPIRHHRFPNFDVAPFFGEAGRQNMMYPIGIRVNHQSVIDALDEAVACGFITAEDRLRVKGYRIVRANKAGWNSIIAKGLLYDSWSYTKKNKTFYYPNYPFNDLRADPYISPTIETYNKGYNAPGHQVGTSFRNTFTNTGRYTFHSPETHFNNPSIEGADELNVETCFTGMATGYFKEVEGHAKYKLSPMSSYIGALLLSTAFVGGPNNYFGFPLTSLIRGPINFITSLFDTSDLNDTNKDQWAASATQNAQAIQQFLNNYELWKTMTEALAPFNNFFVQHQSVGNYLGWEPVTEGDRRRKLTNRAYLPSKHVVIDEDGDQLYFNNWHRETSVYLKVAQPIKTASQYLPDTSRYILSEGGNCKNIETKYDRTVSALYASIRRPMPSQYGTVYSIDWVDTGSYKPLSENFDHILFGGDTFIGKLGIKRKMPFFLYTGVGFTDGADILYSEIGNVGYPNYYFDTQRGFLEKVEDFEQNAFKSFLQSFNDNDILRKLFGLPVYRFDCREDKKLSIRGKVYTYSYGIAYFPVESAVNLDLRHGINNKEGDFYPANQDLDTWLQERNVPIKEDNTFFYNTTYSKQNKEGVIVPMTVDYEPSELCKTLGDNDVIYSSDWRVFKGADRHTFSYKNGRVVSISGIENDKVLVRSEKTFEIFNAYITLPTSADAAIVSTGNLFQNKPQQFSQTDTGHGGTQHTALLQTEHGHIWVNAQTGSIFVLGNNGSGFEDLSRYGMNNWFEEHLPLKILKTFPGFLAADNSYYGVGITLGYDKRKDTLYVTKLDYAVISSKLKYDTALRMFYVEDADGDRTEIRLGDSRYFRNVSWTASFCFLPQVKGWVSFHSFTPNYYISLPTYLQSGVNDDCPSLWNHGLLNHSYQIVYGEMTSFVVQGFTKPSVERQQLKSVAYMNEVIRYHGYDEYYMDSKTFNKALVFNKRQTSGLLYLVPKDPNDQLQHISYPKPTLDGQEILVSRIVNGWSFNQFANLVVGKNNNIPPMVTTPDGTHTVPNPKAVDPFIDVSAREKMKAEVFRIRLINDVESAFKYRFKWFINSSKTDS